MERCFGSILDSIEKIGKLHFEDIQQCVTTMAKAFNYNIFFGAAGWQHAHWQARFYPEDLPEEWKLSFYNTQFRCVYLPSKLWLGRSLKTAESWRDDTQANFRFILETPDRLNQQSTQFLAALGERALIAGADPIHPQLFWFPAEPNLRVLRREIEDAVLQGRNLYLLSREAHLPSLEKVRSLVEVMGC